MDILHDPFGGGPENWSLPEEKNDCALCGEPLNGERLFHGHCADAEQVLADWPELEESYPE